MKPRKGIGRLSPDMGKAAGSRHLDVKFFVPQKRGTINKPIMQTFSIRELRERSGDLSREAEEGRLALVTRHGQPLFVSVPFTDDLLQAGVHTVLAVGLFKAGELTCARAAKLARMNLQQFQAHLSAQGIPVVDHDPAELEQELAAFDAAR